MSWQQDPDVGYERSYRFRISLKHILLIYCIASK